MHQELINRSESFMNQVCITQATNSFVVTVPIGETPVLLVRSESEILEAAQIAVNFLRSEAKSVQVITQIEDDKWLQAIHMAIEDLRLFNDEHFGFETNEDSDERSYAVLTIARQNLREP